MIQSTHTPRCSAPRAAIASLCALRLDAIGAVGIARCLTFGGRFNRTLYDPAVPPRVGLTKEQYMEVRGSAVHAAQHVVPPVRLQHPLRRWCLTRTGPTNRALQGAAKATTINHFYEKLLHLKGLMKTQAGRRVAEERHAFMAAFLTRFYAECEGRA